jgi:hypothetical protein
MAMALAATMTLPWRRGAKKIKPRKKKMMRKQEPRERGGNFLLSSSHS